jgi:ArsR family transcriptional regulator, arsenate/arsenite/antimonite-responsive transcriptional repressor
MARKTPGDPRMRRLETALDQIAKRLDALEGREAPKRGGRTAPAPAAAGPGAGSGGNGGVVARLRDRRGGPYERGKNRGAVLYAGAVTVGEREYLWEVERPVPGLLALEPEVITPILAALASPQRLLLLRTLLAGPKSSHELQRALGVASAGQLYHHLKELLAVGIVDQRDRSAYQIAARHVVPVLAIMAAAFDLGAGS